MTAANGRPMTRDRSIERKLMTRQRKIAEAETALRRERNDLMIEMVDLGYTHREITDLLNKANVEGGEIRLYTQSAVQKAIQRRQEELAST